MRSIDLIVLHCSATPNGRPATVADIRAWHQARGFQDIGYHFVILLDGTRAEGRPIDQPGAHVAGMNAHSIGICMVGGVGGPDKYDPGQYSPAQWASLKRVVADLLMHFPGSKVCGHRDLSPDINGDGVVTPNEWIKVCPSFDVAHWLETGEPLPYNILEP